MADVTFKRIDEMETLYHGVARRARAELGVTGWGMQVYEFPPNWDGHPDHAHGDGHRGGGPGGGLHPARAARRRWSPTTSASSCGPARWRASRPRQRRQILPGPDGFQYVAIGGLVGAHTPSPWTELGGPWPTPPAA